MAKWKELSVKWMNMYETLMEMKWHECLHGGPWQVNEKSVKMQKNECVGYELNIKVDNMTGWCWIEC